MLTLKGESVIKAGVINRNGRYYDQDTINKMVEQFVEMTKKLPSLGEILNDEKASRHYLDVNLRNVSHETQRLYVDGDVLKADIRIIDTPSGNLLNDMLTATPKSFVFRPRGSGYVSAAGKVLDYSLVSVDAVPANDNSYLGIL